VAWADDAGQPEGPLFLPSQFEPAPDFEPRTHAVGTLLVSMYHRGPDDQPKPVVIMGAAEDAGLLRPLPCRLDSETRTVTGTLYRANISDGAIRPLARLDIPLGEIPVIKQVIFSSSETGWGETESKLKEFTVLSDGSVRTRVRTVVELRGGLLVTRVYSFYPGYFTVEASAPERQTGLFSRVWYAQPGTYEDDRGVVRTIDGQGQEEGVGAGYTDPKWYCYYNDQASHACIALSPMEGQSFWDDGSSLGQLGFSTRGASGTYAHVIGGPEKSADFAKRWYEALTKPAVLTIGE